MTYLKIPETIKINKPWGYELFLISSIKGASNFNDFLLPVYMKLIKANDFLSVQVHPNDELAKELEHEPYGKTEAWYIVDAEKDSFLYLGLKNTTNKEIFINALKSGEDITSYLNLVKVKRGDFFYIPAGLIHAIGSGITILEPQQNSNTTYRVFDYNRVFNGKKRDLHIKEAIKAINFDRNFNSTYGKKQEPIKVNLANNYQIIELINSKYFNIKLYKLTDSTTISLNSHNYTLIWVNSNTYVNKQKITNTKTVITTTHKLDIKTLGPTELITVEV